MAVILALAAWQHKRIEVAWQEFMVEVEYARYPALRKQHAQAIEQARFEAAETAAAREAARVAATVVVFTTVPTRTPYVPPAPDVTPVTAVPQTYVPQEPAAPVANATPPPAPEAPSEHRRRFYGVVYDAATLKPVPGAQLVFRLIAAPTGWRATTNELGHYQLDLVKGTVEAPMVVAVAPVEGYREGQLEDTDPPMRERPRSVRRRILEETTDNDLDAVPLRYAADSEIVPLDLVLLPKHGKVTQ